MADQVADPTAAIYAAAIGALADNAKLPSALSIVDLTCPYLGKCAPPGFDRRLKDEIAALLPGRTVTFVGENQGAAARAKVPLVRLGAVERSGETVQVPVSQTSGPMSGSGLVYRLAQRDGRWTVVGTVGDGWTS